MKGLGSVKRLQRERQDCQAKCVPVSFLTGDLYSCYSLLLGPADTPYEGGLYVLSFHFPSDYPFKPPRVRFLTPIFHPGINRNGNICLDILMDQWSPALTLPKVLLSIEDLLRNPNFEDPLNPEANYLYRKNSAEYRQKVEEWKRQYAS